MLRLTKHHIGTWDRREIQQLDRKTVIVVPTGATEQHGFLPIATDTLLAEELALRLAQRYPSQIVITPSLSIGFSDHHFPFPAISLGTQTFTDTLVDMVGS